MKNILRNSNFGFTKWCVALIAAGWMGAAQAQDIVAGWDFQTTTSGGTAVLASPNTQTVFNANVGSGTLYLNGSEGSSAWASATELNAFSGTAINASNGLSTTTTLGAVAVLGGTGNAANGKSISFKFSMTGKKDLQISFAAQRTSTGFVSLVWEWSANGTTWSPIGTISSGTTAGTLASSFATSGVLSLPTVTGLNRATTAYVRATFSGATAASGNARLDNFRFMASADSGGTGPTISDFNPSSGAVGTSVTINGSNFGASPIVKFNGTTAASSVNSGGTQITATVPAGATSGKITVEVAGQTTATSITDFSVTAAGVAAVAVTGGTLTAFSTVAGTASTAQSFTVSGQNLTSDITVTAPTGFEVSTDAQSYASSKTLTQNSGTVASTTISVRIAAGTAAGALASANVTVEATGVTTANVAVSGTVTTPALTLTLNPTSVAENAVAPASTGTVEIPFSLVNDLTVTLVSANTAAATVPASVTIPSGQTSATFEIAAVANSNSYVNATSAITASATNYTSVNATLTVTNVDAAPVSTISLSSLAADSYTQSFDALGTASIPSTISSTAGVQTSLGAVTGSSTLNGWYATKVGGSSSAATAITADAGGGSGGLVYSYGAASASDRALGMLASGSNIMAIGALIKNDTGATINSIKVSFTAEFWRPPNTYTSGSTVTPGVKNTFVCAIGKVDGSTITTANFLTAPSAIPLQRLNIVGPDPVTTGAALDGNSAGNQAPFTDVVIPLQLAAGETAFVRWSDVNDAANDAGLAIDNLRMTASLDLPAADGDGAVSLANSTVSSPYTLSGIWAAGGTAQGVSVNVTPLLESTTLTSVSILVPADFGAPLVENVTSSGGATGGTPTVAGQLITLNGVSITKANPGVINIAGLSTPTTGTIAAGNGVYPFTVSTAGDGGTLKAVFASPAANVLIPIGNIRDIDANGAPVDKNTIVAVEGICTAAPLGGTSFMQDASYGIAVYPATKAFTLGMVAGHKYAVVGTLVDYNGMAEIKPASVSGVVDLGVVSIPTPITITVAAAKAEQYESMLVTIAGLTKDAAETDQWIATKVITVKDSAGDAIDVSIQSELTATPEPVYPVTITGILQQNSSATPRALTYQIMPRTAGDLSFAPGLRLSFAVGALYESTNGGTIPMSGALTVSRTGADTSGALVVALSASPTGLLQFPASVTIPAGQESASVTVGAIDNSAFDAAGFTNVIMTASALGSGLRDGSTTVMILEDDTTYSGWLGQAGASDAAFLDYVFGAVTPGTLDPSLRPTVAVTGGNLVLTYNVRQGTSGLTVTPKTSADLAAGPSGWVTTDVTVADVGAARSVNGVSVQQKTASVPVSGAKKFLRVEAVQQ